MISLVDRVREALKNADENGYEKTGLSAEDIASDLMEYDAEVEYEDFNQVVAAVNEVRMNG